MYRKKRFERLSVIGLLCSSLFAAEHVASKDWATLFLKATSADPEIQEQARDLGLNRWLPDLCEEDLHSAQADAATLASYLQSENHAIRQNSSGYLLMMATNRKDSESALAPILPQVSAVATNSPLEDRVRRNALNLLSSLQPAVPDAALTTLLGLANRKDESLLPAAHIAAGLARRPDRSDAMDALHTALQAASPPVWKQAALAGLITAPPAPTQLVSDIGPLIFDPDKEVHNAALSLLSRKPDYARSNKASLVKLAELNTPDLSEKAKQIIQQLSP